MRLYQAIEAGSDGYPLAFDHWSSKWPEDFERYIAPLRGMNLACYCPVGPSSPCHRDNLLWFAANWRKA